MSGDGLALHFSSPVLLPTAGGGHLTQWTDGFFGFTDGQHALGKLNGGFYSTSDGGVSWSQLWTDAGIDAQEDVDETVDLVPAADGTFFNLARISNQGDGKRNKKNLTSLTASNATQFSLSTDGRIARGVVQIALSFSGVPPPGVHEFRTFGADRIRLPDGTLLCTVIVNGGVFEPGGRASIIAFRSADGLGWSYAGVVANYSAMVASGYPYAMGEGPNENSLAVLTNGSVLCVMRLDATASPVPYASAVSTDGGFSWSEPRSLPSDMGAARPKLLHWERFAAQRRAAHRAGARRIGLAEPRRRRGELAGTQHLVPAQPADAGRWAGKLVGRRAPFQPTPQHDQFVAVGVQQLHKPGGDRPGHRLHRVQPF